MAKSLSVNEIVIPFRLPRLACGFLDRTAGSELLFFSDAGGR
jgi:hypothetical protein